MNVSAKILSIDHVQLAMPKGNEELARSFYRDVLGMKEVSKPEPLAGRFILPRRQIRLERSTSSN